VRWAHGGVEEWALAVFETGAGILFFLWSLFALLFKEKEIVFPTILPPLLAFAGVVGLQWFFRRTASPYDTRMQLQLFACGYHSRFSCVSGLSHPARLARFFLVRDALRFFLAGFGILQHLTFNGKTLLRFGRCTTGEFLSGRM